MFPVFYVCGVSIVFELVKASPVSVMWSQPRSVPDPKNLELCADLPGLHHRSLHVSEAAVESAEVGCSASVPLISAQPAMPESSLSLPQP